MIAHPCAYDRLSINIGSTPKSTEIGSELTRTIPVKPICEFNARWLALLARAQTQPGSMHIALVGGGAGGVELILAMHQRLRHELSLLDKDPNTLKFSLFTRRGRYYLAHALSSSTATVYTDSSVSWYSLTC